MKFYLCLLLGILLLQFVHADLLNAEKLAIIQLVPDDRDNNKLVYVTNEMSNIFRKEFAKKGWEVLDEGKTKDMAKSLGVDWGKSEITSEQAMKMREMANIDYVISGRVTLADEEKYRVSLLITYTCIGNADRQMEIITSNDDKDMAKQVDKIDEEIKNLKCSFSAEYISRGTIYYDDEKYPDAEKEFKKALDVDPGNMDAAIYLGSIYFKQKKFDDAIAFYSEMLKKNPKNDNLLVALALTYEEMQQEDKALQMYESAALNKSKGKVVYVSLYRLYKKKGMDKKATEALDMLVKLNPNDVDVWFNVGFGLYQTGKFGDAAEIFQNRVLPEYEKNNKEKVWLIQSLIGDSKSRLGQYSAAAAAYQAALSSITSKDEGVIDDLRYRYFRSVYSQDKNQGAALAKSFISMTKNDRYREIYRKVSESGSDSGNADTQAMFKQAQATYDSAKEKALVKPFNAGTIESAIPLFRKAKGLYAKLKIDAGVRNCDKMIEYCQQRLKDKR